MQYHDGDDGDGDGDGDWWLMMMIDDNYVDDADDGVDDKYDGVPIFWISFFQGSILKFYFE